jgi:hypothetical protein
MLSGHLEQGDMPNEKRFLIAVFNHGRIESLTANIRKIVDLDFKLDTLLVLDSSEDMDDQKAALAAYCEHSGLNFGVDVMFKPRTNWGLAEGGRVDFAADLRRQPVQHSFVLQFQDHYLDTTSEYSVWPAGKVDLEGKDISGEVKGDCIKSGQTIELDGYAKLLSEGSADVLYSSQNGIGLFPYWQENFFCIDGVNFAASIDTFLKIFDEQTCSRLAASFDDSYKWALFAEHYVGYRMMRLGLKLCDTYHEMVFSNVYDLVKGLKSETCLTDMMHVSERYYAELFREYMEKALIDTA